MTFRLSSGVIDIKLMVISLLRGRDDTSNMFSQECTTLKVVKVKETQEWWFNSSSPGQNGRHFTDNIFRSIFLNEEVRILIRISPKFVPNDLIDNNSALIQIMAHRLFGAEPLSEPMLIRFIEAYVRHQGEMG